MQGGNLRSDRRFGGAKIPHEHAERRLVLGSTWDDEGIMVAGDGKDRRRVIAEWLVKLIVIVLRFTKVVNDVPQMKEECRPIRCLGTVGVHRKLIGDAN